MQKSRVAVQKMTCCTKKRDRAAIRKYFGSSIKNCSKPARSGFFDPHDEDVWQPPGSDNTGTPPRRGGGCAWHIQKHAGKIRERGEDSHSVPLISMGVTNKLRPNDETLQLITALAAIMATKAEAAAALGVHEGTLRSFLKRHEEARFAWASGHVKATVHVYRCQRRLALKARPGRG